MIYILLAKENLSELKDLPKEAKIRNPLKFHLIQLYFIGKS